MKTKPTTFTITTTNAPGAIGVIQLVGPNATAIIQQLTGIIPNNRCQLADFAGIDEGLIVALNNEWCQLMPHGGLRVMQLVCERLISLGAQKSENICSSEIYPEATSELEADMLLTLAHAVSPAAIALLMEQPNLWQQAMLNGNINKTQINQIIQNSVALNHLITPPSVVLIGQANVGKSTLSNLIIGRQASITADMPGTTRDWVTGVAKLHAPLGQLAINWFDTPGLRQSNDTIERKAIQLAKQIIQQADVLIAMRDLDTDWPTLSDSSRQPDLWVVNKVDLLKSDQQIPHTPTGEMVSKISSLNDQGISELSSNIIEKLGLLDVASNCLWTFSQRLDALLTDDNQQNSTQLAQYVGSG